MGYVLYIAVRFVDEPGIISDERAGSIKHLFIYKSRLLV
jgi:hypothetical protein